MITASELLAVPVQAIAYAHPINRRPRGGHGKGQMHPKAKLTNAQAVEIRNRYARGSMSYRILSGFYDVGESTIRDIVTWRTFTNAGGDSSYAKGD